MHKKNLRILIKLIFIMLFVIGIANISFADDNFNFKDFNNKDVLTNASKAYNATEHAMGTAINVIKIVGTGTAIIMITYIAIKYMTAAPSEKADFKKSAAIYIVGATLILAATNILAIIINFTTTNIT